MSGPTSDYLNYSSDLELTGKSCFSLGSVCSLVQIVSVAIKVQIQDLNYSSDRLSCYQIQIQYFQILPSYLTIRVPKDYFFAMKLNQFIGLSRKMASAVQILAGKNSRTIFQILKK